MSAREEKKRTYSARRFAMAEARCPACGAVMRVEAQRCGGCGFTGAYTMRMFPEQPPALTGILDVAGLWDGEERGWIHKARKKQRKRTGQVDWRVCVVGLDPAVDLSVFGFWLFNAAPLVAEETEEERAWTVLLVIDPAGGRSAVIPGYAAEPWLTDDEWNDALRAMDRLWLKGRTAEGVIAFIETSGKAFERALKRVLRSLVGKERG